VEGGEAFTTKIKIVKETEGNLARWNSEHGRLGINA
jgi:hypothetical protein